MAEFTSLNGYDVKDKKAVRVYDNVETMKEDYSIRAGQIVQTLGYYEPNDGGSAEYIITDTSSLTDYQEELENTLYATLIVENNTINVKQLGAYGDGVHDDLIPLKTAVDNYNNVLFNEGIYTISDTLYLNSNNHLKGNNTVIYNASTHPALRGETKDNIVIDGLTVRDNASSNNQHGIYLYGTNLVVKNCTLDNVTGDGIAFGTSKNVLVENCKILNSGRISILAFEGNDVTFRNLYIKGAGHKYTCQFKSCVNSTMENILIEEGSEISCLSTKQALSENPDAITPTNITIKNIKIIDHSKGWTPQDANLIACLFEGNNYYVSDIQVINSYTGAMKVELNDSIVENIIVDGYGLNGSNVVGVILTDATDYGKNNIVKNIHIKNGIYQGLRSNLTNSIIEDINIIDCGTSSQLQFASADINSIINNVYLETKTIDCRGLGFAFGSNVASKSSYTNIKRNKAVGHSAYDISGSSYPSDIYINCPQSLRYNGGRGSLTGPFIYDNGKMTMFELNGTNGVTPSAGDVVVYKDSKKLTEGYDRAYYDGANWINIIPISQ